MYSFDYSRSYNFIVSCGLERSILLWNPFTGRSIGTLQGHTASVQDVIVNEQDSQLISVSIDKVIKIWDIRSNKCMQTIIDSGIYWPENRISAITYNPARQSVVRVHRLVLARQTRTSNVLCLVQVLAGTHLEQYKRFERGEESLAPICDALYNVPFRQVAYAMHIITRLLVHLICIFISGQVGRCW